MENYERRCKGGAWRRRKEIEPEINSEMQKDREREKLKSLMGRVCRERTLQLRAQCAQRYASRPKKLGNRPGAGSAA